MAVGPRAAYVAFATRQPGTDHSDIVLTASADGGRTWSEPAWWIGGYQGLAAGPKTFHPLWNDGRAGQLELFTTTVG